MKPLSVYLIGAARKVWRWSPARRAVKDAAKVGKKYQCQECKKVVAKVQIDHIEPVGVAPKDWNGWDEYYRKLFCSASNLRAVCTVCHKKKSAKEAHSRAANKSSRIANEKTNLNNWKWPYRRVNFGGEMEFDCPHGIGHGGLHGCDGCCSHPSFQNICKCFATSPYICAVCQKNGKLS